MSEPSDLAHWSTGALVRALASRRVSPVDIIEAYLARIEAYDGQLHAYTEVYARDARLAAEAADKAIRAGQSVGPLHGIPVAIKDLAEIEGRITTGGCSVWHERRSTLTATLVQRMIAQGMIVLGKTHMVEFAFGGWGTNTRMGTPRNPWDMACARTPGGSSSGSGVAVAAGLAPWAVGTDTGGSVRLPSSYCGLTGLKTSVGRISTHGLLALSPTLDTPGPMAHSAEDAALLYQVLQGADPCDPATLRVPAQGPLDMLRRGVQGMRLARLPQSELEGVSPAVLQAYHRSLDELADLGAEITSVRLPCAFADVAGLNGQIMAAESYALLSEMVDDAALPLDEDVRPRVLAGREISARTYLCALEQRRRMTAALDQAIQDVDGILTPATATTALPLTEVNQRLAPSGFTRFVNFFDLCALALPNGFDAQGLPTSLQVIGRRYHEADVLRVGHAYQMHTDWHERRPQMPLVLAA